MAKTDCKSSERWVVVDRKNGAVVGNYSSATRARKARDRKDNEYGGYRYAARRTEEQPA